MHSLTASKTSAKSVSFNTSTEQDHAVNPGRHLPDGQQFQLRWGMVTCSCPSWPNDQAPRASCRDQGSAPGHYPGASSGDMAFLA